MNKVVKRILIALLCFVGIVTVLSISVLYITRWKLTDVGIETSPDGRYSILFQEKGEPDWPFGKSHARITVYEGKQVIKRFDENVADDGCRFQKVNYSVDWFSTGVVITFHGSEQYDQEVILMYDGSEQFDDLLKERQISETIIEHEEDPEYVEESPESIEEKADELLTNFRTVSSPNNELVFSASIDDYIEAYNNLYQADHNRDFLTAKSQWTILKQYKTDYLDYEGYLYRFQQDTANYVEPNICVYVPADADNIQAITLDFDDHGYAEWALELYIQECLYTFKVLFPTMDNSYLEMMFNELFEMAYSDDCFVNDFEKAEPSILFYGGDIGIYPYYSMGVVFICIIPITQDYVSCLAAKGIELVEIN